MGYVCVHGTAGLPSHPLRQHPGARHRELHSLHRFERDLGREAIADRSIGSDPPQGRNRLVVEAGAANGRIRHEVARADEKRTPAFDPHLEPQLSHEGHGPAIRDIHHRVDPSRGVAVEPVPFFVAAAPTEAQLEQLGEPLQVGRLPTAPALPEGCHRVVRRSSHQTWSVSANVMYQFGTCRTVSGTHSARGLATTTGPRPRGR